MARKRDPEETPPSAEYERAARLLAEGRSRDEVEALCPGVDLHDPWILAHSRGVEAAAKATDGLDQAEIKRRLLEIVNDDETEPELRVKILLGLLDRC